MTGIYAVAWSSEKEVSYASLFTRTRALLALTAGGRGALGATPASNLRALLIEAPLYGGGVVLIRELVRRRGGGWGRVALLGAAYAIVEEGLAILSRSLTLTRSMPASSAAGPSVSIGFGASGQSAITLCGASRSSYPACRVAIPNATGRAVAGPNRPDHRWCALWIRRTGVRRHLSLRGRAWFPDAAALVHRRSAADCFARDPGAALARITPEPHSDNTNTQCTDPLARRRSRFRNGGGLVRAARPSTPVARGRFGAAADAARHPPCNWCGDPVAPLVGPGGQWSDLHRLALVIRACCQLL